MLSKVSNFPNIIVPDPSGGGYKTGDDSIRLKPEQRRQIANMVRKELRKKVVAEIFGVSRQTVWTWCKRANHCGRASCC